MREERWLRKKYKVARTERFGLFLCLNEKKVYRNVKNQGYGEKKFGVAKE